MKNKTFRQLSSLALVVVLFSFGACSSPQEDMLFDSNIFELIDEASISPTKDPFSDISEDPITIDTTLLEDTTIKKEPTLLEKISDFDITIDITNGFCSLNWEKYLPEGEDLAYHIEAIGNDNYDDPIFSCFLDYYPEPYNSFFFPTNIEKLCLRLHYKNGDAYSEIT